MKKNILKKAIISLMAVSLTGSSMCSAELYVDKNLFFRYQYSNKLIFSEFIKSMSMGLSGDRGDDFINLLDAFTISTREYIENGEVLNYYGLNSRQIMIRLDKVVKDIKNKMKPEGKNGQILVN